MKMTAPTNKAGTASYRRWLQDLVLPVRLVCASLMICMAAIQPAFSQATADPLISGFQPHLPSVPSKLSSLSSRFQEASSFIDSLSKNDAMFEVVLGQGRLLVLKEDLIQDNQKKTTEPSLVAVGNPDVLEFELVGSRQIRLIGKQIGVTDLVVTKENQKSYSYEIHVVYDLNLVQARIRELMPDAYVRVAQMGKSLVVEGQARDAVQIRQILELVRRGVLTNGVGGSAGNGQAGADIAPTASMAAPDSTGGTDSIGPEIINLLRVPGPQQVMLKVQVAELDRTAMRQIGSDFLLSKNGQILGTRLSNATSTGSSTGNGSGLLGQALTTAGSSSPATAFGIFEGIGFQALRGENFRFQFPNPERAVGPRRLPFFTRSLGFNSTSRRTSLTATQFGCPWIPKSVRSIKVWEFKFREPASPH
jgi:hypothetical protein